MNLSLIRSMTRSAVFELENGLCYRPAHPFTVTLNGKTVYEACQTNVFSLFSLLPGTEYTVGVQAEGESLTCTFTTEAETFFVDASRYGLVADGTTDNTLKLQAALSTCPKAGTLGVAWSAFFPYLFLLYLTPVFSIFYGFTGISIKHLPETKNNESKEEK